MELKTLSLRDWSKGINKAKSDFEIETKELIVGENIFVEEAAIIKRKGYTKLTSSPIVSGKAVLSIYEYYKESTGDSFLLANCGGKLAKIDTTTGEVTNIKTGLTDGYMVDYATMNDYVYMVNGIDAVMRYDGTNLTTPAGCSKKTKFIINHRDLMFYIATSGAPNTVYFSQAGDPETIDADAYFQVSTTDGDILTGVFSLFDYLFLPKNYSIHRLQGLQKSELLLSNSLVDAFPKTGCVSYKSIQHVIGGVMFLGVENKQHSIYFITPSGLLKVSDNVDKFLDKLSIANRDQAAGFWEGKHYRLAYPTGANAYPNEQLVFHFPSKAFTSFTYGMTCFCVGRGGTIYAGGSDGNIYKIDNGLSDNGSAIQMNALTKIFDFGSLISLKKGSIDVDANSDVNLAAIINRGERNWSKSFNLVGGTTSWGDNNWAIDAGTVSVTNDSAIVILAGAAWTLVQAGDSFKLDGDDTTYTVLSLDSPTQITLTSNYEGTTASGETYVIWNEDTLLWTEASVQKQRFSFGRASMGRNVQFQLLENADDSEVKIYGVDSRFTVLTGEK